MTPPEVLRALSFAEDSGFTNSCTPEVGRLLRVLTAAAGPGVIAELGTGCGVGAAWLLSGLRDDQTFISVDADEARQAQVERLLERKNARFLAGDWRGALHEGPFSLVFADVSEAKDEGHGEVVAATAPGGLIVLDDFTPEKHWPEAWRGKPDRRRERWFGDTRLLTTEILVTERAAVLLAVKVDNSLADSQTLSISARAERGNRGTFERALNKVRDVEPEPNDRL